MGVLSVSLQFATTGRWATVRLGDDLAAWSDTMAAARGGRPFWGAVAGGLFTGAYPDAYAALVLVPETADGPVTTVLRLSNHAGQHPVLQAGTLRETGGGDWIDEPVLTPYDTSAGPARRVVARFTGPPDETGTADVAAVLAYWWWFPGDDLTLELRTVMTEYVDLRRALPAADALAASAARSGEGPPAAEPGA